MTIEYQYIISDYYATGEGRTVSILITRALPKISDYDTPGTFDDAGTFHKGRLNSECSPEFIAKREFTEIFGSWIGAGATAMSKDEFLQRWKHLIPNFVHNIINEVDEPPGNFNYYQQYHLNFS